MFRAKIYPLVAVLGKLMGVGPAVQQNGDFEFGTSAGQALLHAFIYNESLPCHLKHFGSAAALNSFHFVPSHYQKLDALYLSILSYNPLILSSIQASVQQHQQTKHQQSCIRITFSPSLSSLHASMPFLSTSISEPIRLPW